MIAVIKYPALSTISNLLQRPYANSALVKESVIKILGDVKARGDNAIKDFTLQFDKIVLNDFKVNKNELAAAEALVDNNLKAAIAVAHANIKKFHIAQKQSDLEIETMPGVICLRKSVAIESVGLYIPGGSAPLFSTLLMLAIPASIVGCKEIVVCTPCNKSGEIDKSIAYVAHFLGITEVYKIGGAQAIAAMAYGTETIKKVDKIFGPGNQYVTAAKQLVQAEGTAIDMPAGPSEVLVIADKYANPIFIAADLLSQAEHGADSQVVLLSDDAAIFDKVNTELENQLTKLNRKDTATASLINAKFVLTKNIASAIDASNIYAPEHLILNIENAEAYLDKIINAGSVFIGAYSPESVGDYASGTNHTLPTNGYTNAYSGVSLDSFVKKITFQKLSQEGIKNIGNTVMAMAMAEGLDAHANAVRVRLDSVIGKTT
jgi:histidinol dehydrogenase